MTNEEHSAHYLLLKGIISAGLVGVGFFTGGALSGLVAGFVGSVGGNWFSNLSENAFDSYCRHWFTHDGALNHDLCNALARAFQGAVRQTSDEWQATDAYQRLDRHNAEMTRKALNWLHDDTQRLFERDTLGDLLAEREADLLAMVQAHTPAAAPALPANLLGPILDEYLILLAKPSSPSECRLSAIIGGVFWGGALLKFRRFSCHYFLSLFRRFPQTRPA